MSYGDPTESGMPARYARRALLRAAVFDTRDHELLARRPATATSVATGVLAEVREDAIALDSSRGTELFAVSPGTVTWLGARTTPTALRSGDPVIIRHRTPDPGTPTCRLAERIWACVGRVTGTIVAADGHEFLVDGHPREQQRVVIAPASARQIQVRFPRLAPGYLLDVIGTRHGDYLLAVAPATAQPPYHAGHSPGPPLVSGPVTMPVSGSAVWHEPDDEPPGLLGLGYPAIDPEAGTEPGSASLLAAAPGASGCRTCRSAARYASATSALTAQPCCPSRATAPWPGSSATGAWNAAHRPRDGWPT